MITATFAKQLEDCLSEQDTQLMIDIQDCIISDILNGDKPSIFYCNSFDIDMLEDAAELVRKYGFTVNRINNELHIFW